ncbi:MAG: hypothetical protein KIS96_01085 [Bauldia sp.]|nr:hypothetical protein [Bauldia sp.]
MAIADTPVASPRPRLIWFAVGVALLAYAVLGNYLVLPGYRRFLEGGSPNEGQSGVDFALIWGATRTIVWMMSFHVGAFCLAIAALAAQGDAIRTFRRWFAIGALVWLGLWTVPSIPGPYTILFALLGMLILVMIVLIFGRATLNAARTGSHFSAFRGGHWQVASYFFFALATWDLCGLGSVGGMLDPDGAVRAANQSLMVAQTTKLIIEILIAWGLLAVAAFPRATSHRR